MKTEVNIDRWVKQGYWMLLSQRGRKVTQVGDIYVLIRNSQRFNWQMTIDKDIYFISSHPLQGNLQLRRVDDQCIINQELRLLKAPWPLLED